jgi:hypothetical protein
MSIVPEGLSVGGSASPLPAPGFTDPPGGSPGTEAGCNERPPSASANPVGLTGRSGSSVNCAYNFWQLVR